MGGWGRGVSGVPNTLHIPGGACPELERNATNLSSRAACWPELSVGQRSGFLRSWSSGSLRRMSLECGDMLDGRKPAPGWKRGIWQMLPKCYPLLLSGLFVKPQLPHERRVAGTSLDNIAPPHGPNIGLRSCDFFLSRKGQRTYTWRSPGRQVQVAKGPRETRP